MYNNPYTQTNDSLPNVCEGDNDDSADNIDWRAFDRLMAYDAMLDNGRLESSQFDNDVIDNWWAVDDNLPDAMGHEVE